MRISDWSSDVCSSDLDTDQIELELLEPAVDDLDRGLNEVSRRDDIFEWHVDAAQLCLGDERSEEHTSELQSLMRISYAVFCLHKKLHSLLPTTIIYH